jgi:nucleoside-diphosphate-sugar epimerase
MLMKSVVDERWFGADRKLRLPLNGDEPVNLVPIDYVVKFIATVIRENPRPKEQYYHVVPKVPFTIRQVVDAIVDYFDFDGIELVGKRELSQPNEIETLLEAYLGPYHSYFGTDSYFSTEAADKVMSWQPENPQEQLKRWIDYAVESKFGRERAN